MKRDAADVACEDWASVMRVLLGVTEPRRAREYVGSLRCTLAARRDLHHGGRSGRIEQHWPEFPWVGHPQGALVHAVYQRMPESLQEILTAHYVPLAPRSKGLRADLMGLSTRIYWDRVARAKCQIFGALAVVETVRTVSTSERGIYAASVTVTSAD